MFAVVTGEDAKRWCNPTATVPEGWGTYCLATDKVRFVGEPVAAVAAVSRYVAEDALEQIQSSTSRCRPSSTRTLRSIARKPARLRGARHQRHAAARVHVGRRRRRRSKTRRTSSTEKFRWNRLGANPLETFGVVSQWDLLEGTITCHGSFQSQFHMALARGAVFGLPSNKVRLVAQPHGGSFGGKGGARGTDITILLSRKCGGRPVKWIEDRMEYLTGGAGQAWDRHYDGVARAGRGRQGHRLPREAARRSRRDGGRLGRGELGEAARGFHRLLRDSDRAVRSDDRRDQQAAGQRRTAAWARRRTTSCSSD